MIKNIKAIVQVRAEEELKALRIEVADIKKKNKLLEDELYAARELQCQYSTTKCCN